MKKHVLLIVFVLIAVVITSCTSGALSIIFPIVIASITEYYIYKKRIDQIHKEMKEFCFKLGFHIVEFNNVPL
jgi:uncharacterized membrane protein